MTRSRPLRLACLGAACLVGWMALPTGAAGHQRAALEAGVLTITGDHPSPAGEPKPNDLVTLDTAGDDLVVGNDVFGPHPAQCRPSAEHPQRIILCPRTLVSEIRISIGIGGDSVVAAVPVPIVAAMGADNDSFRGGSEVDTVRGGPGSDKAFLGAGADTASMGSGTDKAYGGAGRDTLKGGGASDQLFGEGGADLLLGGGGSDKLLAGGGNDKCDDGPGAGQEISC